MTLLLLCCSLLRHASNTNLHLALGFPLIISAVIAELDKIDVGSFLLVSACCRLVFAFYKSLLCIFTCVLSLLYQVILLLCYLRKKINKKEQCDHSAKKIVN